MKHTKIILPFLAMLMVHCCLDVQTVMAARLNPNAAVMVKQRIEGRLQTIRELEGKTKFDQFARLWSEVEAAPDLRTNFPDWYNQVKSEYDQIRGQVMPATKVAAAPTTATAMASATPAATSAAPFATQAQQQAYVQGVITHANFIPKNTALFSEINASGFSSAGDLWARHQSDLDLVKVLSFHANFSAWQNKIKKGSAWQPSSAQDLAQMKETFATPDAAALEDIVVNETSFWVLFDVLENKSLGQWLAPATMPKQMEKCSAYFAIAFNKYREKQLGEKFEKARQTIYTDVIGTLGSGVVQKALGVSSDDEAFEAIATSSEKRELLKGKATPAKRVRISTAFASYEDIRRKYEEIETELTQAKGKLESITGVTSGAAPLKTASREKISAGARKVADVDDMDLEGEDMSEPTPEEGSSWTKKLLKGVVYALVLAGVGKVAYDAYTAKKDGQSFGEFAKAEKDSIIGVFGNLRDFASGGVETVRGAAGKVGSAIKSKVFGSPAAEKADAQ